MLAGAGLLLLAGGGGFVWFGTDWMNAGSPEPRRSGTPATPSLASRDPAPAPDQPLTPPEPPPAPALAVQLAAIPCSTVTATDGAAGTTVFHGVIGSGAPRGALDAILWPMGTAAARTGVQTFPKSATLCRMAELVRANDGGAGTGLVRLTMANGRTTLTDGDEVRMSVRMPDFDGEVRLEDLNAQGQVLHLVEAVLGAPPPRHRAGELVPLGRDGDDAIGTVDPPFGAELVVAVVASEPLFATPRAQGEAPDGYLRALEAAVRAVRGRGGRVAMDAVVVTTGER